MLEIRLATLDRVVDRFVLVESTVTHANHDKPLFFAENKERYAAWNDKIIHIVVHENPGDPDPWVREKHQRDQILLGLRGARDSDLAILSDVDEIPDPDVLAKLARAGGPIVFEQFNCYYYLNAYHGFWMGSRLATVDCMRKMGPSVVRHIAGNIISGGWHFSFLGGVDAIVNKVRSYAHQEYNDDNYTDRDIVSAALATGSDLFRRYTSKAQLLPLDKLPVCVKSDLHKYKQFRTDSIRDVPTFHESWYNIGKIRALKATAEHVSQLSGRVIEIGCWEGNSTSNLARVCYPEIIHAVDTWQGNLDESKGHVTIDLARQRDVYRDFPQNMFILTKGNFQPHKMRSVEYLQADQSPVRFCHLDASHDYQSVKTEIELLLPMLVPGGILCGDDFENASLDSPGLDGGVERAVKELLLGFRNDGNFWFWRKGAPTPPLPSLFGRLRRRFALQELAQGLQPFVRARLPNMYSQLQQWWWRRQNRKRARKVFGRNMVSI